VKNNIEQRQINLKRLIVKPKGKTSYNPGQCLTPAVSQRYFHQVRLATSAAASSTSHLSIPKQGFKGPVIQALFLTPRVQRRDNSALIQKTFPTTNVSNSALFKAFWSMTPPKLLNVSVT
jgi:hypothetical protein